MSTLQTSAPPRINDTPEQTLLNAFFAEKTPAGAAGGTMQMARSPRKPLAQLEGELGAQVWRRSVAAGGSDRKSTRLNSSHVSISYAVFCLKKKNVYQKYLAWLI